jgi:hypothetical protein
MTLQEMLGEVVRTSETKKDYVADTQETIRMVRMPDFKDGVALVLSQPTHPKIIYSSSLDAAFEITDHCHKQIAARLKIPAKYYTRLLADHRDLVIENVNTLFEREPELRMIRTLDGKARAFLSNSYRRVDNDEILEATLPVIQSDFDTTMLNTHVNDERLRLKCLFNGDEHKIELPQKNGRDNIVHAGFEMGNCEVGGGSFYLRGFLYSGYCLNGCVYGMEDTVSMRQIHVGSKLGIPDDFILSDDTKRKEDDLIISAARDVLANLADPAFTQKVGARIATLSHTKTAVDPHTAVETVCKEVGISETDSKSVLESFIRDQDYTQWGMVNAVTSVQHKKEAYEDAHHFEELGAKIINLPANQWSRIATAERLAA